MSQEELDPGGMLWAGRPTSEPLLPGQTAGRVPEEDGRVQPSWPHDSELSLLSGREHI